MRSSPKATCPYCANGEFQFHHEPFTYFKWYGEGTPGRANHLKDERDFIYAVRHGLLRQVSLVKPLGQENEHPGYASESQGSDTWSICSRRSWPARRRTTPSSS